MRFKLLKILLCFFFAALMDHSQAQTFESLNDLSKQFIKSLKKQDISEFRETYTQDSTLLDFLSKDLGFNMGYALERDFVRILKEGREKGIVWDDIKLLKTDFSIHREGPFLIAQPTEIVFEHRIFRYSISVNCTKFNSSWSFVPIARKSEVIHLVPIGFEKKSKPR